MRLRCGVRPCRSETDFKEYLKTNDGNRTVFNDIEINETEIIYYKIYSLLSFKTCRLCY